MKIASDKNPVMSDWLPEQGLRLDASPYLSGALEARKLLDKLPVPKDKLWKVTFGHDGGIFNGPKFRRVYVQGQEDGVPFLGSTDMMEADFSYLPRLRKTDATSAKLSFLRVTPGSTLISCSGSIGRMAYVRPDMDGFWSSQDILKVVPDPKKIPSGYLYTYLSSRYGSAIVKSSAYGAIIQHLEPRHIVDVPVPRFGEGLEQRIHGLVEESARLRAGFQASLHSATSELLRSVGLSDLVEFDWSAEPRDVGFVVWDYGHLSLRPANYEPRARNLLERIRETDCMSLGEICSGGYYGRSNRFKRIFGESSNSVRLVGQREAFWTRPEGSSIMLGEADRALASLDSDAVLVAMLGSVGEKNLICRPSLICGSWLKEYVFSENFLRLQSGIEEVTAAYLFAFLRSEVAFRVMRSMLHGSAYQVMNLSTLKGLPIPIASQADMKRISEIVWRAYRDRDQADKLEDEAQALLTKAIEEAAV